MNSLGEEAAQVVQANGSRHADTNDAKAELIDIGQNETAEEEAKDI